MADNETYKTVADIAERIRHAVSQLGDDMPYIVMARQMRSLADDIVAAHNRAVQDALDTGGYVEAVRNRKRATTEKSSAVGDAAKLREAVVEIINYLEPIRKWTMPSQENGTKLTALFAAVDTVYQKAKEALAAPPRNCDKYSHDEALNIWAAENENERNGCFDEWLYHDATEQEGGNDAD